MRSSPKTIAIDLKIRECSGSPPPRLCNLVKLKLKNAKKKNCEGESFELGIRNMMVTLINKSLPLTSWIISAEFAPFSFRLRLRDGERTCLYVREKIRTKSWKCTTMPQSSSKGKSVNGLLLLEVFFPCRRHFSSLLFYFFVLLSTLYFFAALLAANFPTLTQLGEKNTCEKGPPNQYNSHTLWWGVLCCRFFTRFSLLDTRKLLGNEEKRWQAGLN